MDIEKFAQGMKELKEFYGTKFNLSENAMQVWFRKLSWLDSRDYLAAVDQITDLEKFPPTPDVVKKFAGLAKERRSAADLQKDNSQVQSFFKPESHAPGIARDCVEFIETIQRFPRGSIEKLQFEVSWNKAMMQKYPNAEFDKNYRTAVRDLNERLANKGQSNVMNI